MKQGFLIFLTVMGPLLPTYAGYPVIDIPDLAMDLGRMTEAIMNTRKEIEKYQVMTQQLAHYYFQAKRLIEGDVDIEKFLIRGFEFYFQKEIVDVLFGYVDPQLDAFMELYDGVHDLKYKINQLKQQMNKLFEGPRNVRGWQTPHFRLGDVIITRAEQSEAAVEHIRGSIGQGLAWVGETKYAHPQDKEAYGLAHHIWETFQKNPDDTRGRQLGYDLINADIGVLKEVMQKQLRVLQSYQTTEGLKQAQQLNKQDKRMQNLNDSLTRLSESIDDWEPVRDSIGP